MSPTLAELAADLAAGRTSSEQLVDECLARIDDDDGEGRFAFLEVDREGARRSARELDGLRHRGEEPSPYAGIPVSVKDLFDVRGQRTRAGSVVLDGGPAAQDAPAVARWRAAGFVVLGRTNMTEFAFSGLGLNPHYGTPANPWDRERRRIPGGSTSGGAVSVTDGMAHGALGSDTGGSCRIPAALCGIVGFKPTRSRVPRGGLVPLSSTLDAVGVLGKTVACCTVLDAVAAREQPAPAPLAAAPRLAVVRNYFLAEADGVVARDFGRALDALADAGAHLVEVEVPELDGIPEMNAGGGFAAAESWAWHRDRIARSASAYDPRVLVRIARGEAITPADLAELRARRQALLDGVKRRVAGCDAFVCPTVPLVAPGFDEVTDDADYSRINLLMLRNPTVVNLLGGCSVSVPMNTPGAAPTGLMISGFAGEDATILQIGAWIEERL